MHTISKTSLLKKVKCMKISSEEFAKLKEKNPWWSSLTTLANIVMYKHFWIKEIESWLSKYVDKDDYYKSEKPSIVTFLCEITNADKNKVVKNIVDNSLKK